MNLILEDLDDVCVYPDGNNTSEPLKMCGDDYERRKTTQCMDCDSTLEIHYAEPFASCECGTTEWYQ